MSDVFTGVASDVVLKFQSSFDC